MMSRYKENKIKEVENHIELLSEYKHAIEKIYCDIEYMEVNLDPYDKIENGIDDAISNLVYYKDYVLPYEKDDVEIVVEFEWEL